MIRIGMGGRLESPNIPRGARGLVLVAGWVDSCDPPIHPGEQGDYDRCGWAAGILNLPGGTGD